MTGSNIWQLQSQGDIQGILAAVEAGDAVIRGRGITALATMGAREAIPDLTRLHHRENNPQVRALLEETLQALSAPAAAEDFREIYMAALNSQDDDESLEAIQALAKLGDRSVVEYLVILFRDEDRSARLRLAAAEALLTLQSAPASAALLGALRKSDWQVRRNAVAVLGQLRADWAVLPLAEMMREDPNLTVRKTAAAALRRINTDDALAELGRVASTQDLD